MNQEQVRMISAALNRTGKQSATNLKWENVVEISEFVKANWTDTEYRTLPNQVKARIVCQQFGLPTNGKSDKDVANTWMAFIGFCRRWKPEHLDRVEKIVVNFTDAVRDTESDTNEITSGVCMCFDYVSYVFV